MKYTIVPNVWTGDGWSLSKTFMEDLWNQIETHKLHKIVFCSGGVFDANSFIKYFRCQSNLFHIITMHDDGFSAIGGFMWLNGIRNNHALFHGCAFPMAWGKYAHAMGEESFKYWFNIKKDDGYLFDTIICEIPEWNTHAINYAERLGAKKVGSIPNIANDIYTDGKSDMIIFYKERGG